MTEFQMQEPVLGTLEYLYWKNLHHRDKFVSFEEGPHIYTIHGKRGESTSVTTWVHQHFPNFDSEGIVNRILKSPKWSNDPEYKYYKMSKEDILASWKKNTDNSTSSGTKLHNDIEKFYNGMEIENDSVEYSFFLKFKEDYKHLIPFRTEWMVYHEELKLVGSIDMIFENENGELEIYDWKRSKEIVYDNNYNKFAITPSISHLPDTNFWHYSLQLNTYRKIIESKYDKKVTGLYLVRFHPDNPYKTYDRINVPLLDKEMDTLFEERKKELEKTT